MPPRKKAEPDPIVDVMEQQVRERTKASPSIIVRFEPAFPIDELQPYHLNPRRGKVDVIRESIDENGLYKAIVVNIGTLTGRPNEILAGNHTYLSALEEGAKTIPVGFVDVDDQRAAKIVLADNATSDKATNDADQMRELVASLDDLRGSGITADEFAKMVSDAQGDDDPDTSPQLPEVGFAVIIDCRDESQQYELLAQFEEEGLQARPLML